MSFLKTDHLSKKFTSFKRENLSNFGDILAEIEKGINRTINGDEKNDLTSWWHNLIQTSTDSFLLSKGFIEHCPSFDYVKNK